MNLTELKRGDNETLEMLIRDALSYALDDVFKWDDDCCCIATPESVLWVQSFIAKKLYEALVNEEYLNSYEFLRARGTRNCKYPDKDNSAVIKLFPMLHVIANLARAELVLQGKLQAGDEILPFNDTEEEEEVTE